MRDFSGQRIGNALVLSQVFLDFFSDYDDIHDARGRHVARVLHKTVGRYIVRVEAKTRDRLPDAMDCSRVGLYLWGRRKAYCVRFGAWRRALIVSDVVL